MKPLRRTSLIFGLFFAGTFIFSIPALFIYDPVLHNAEYILVSNGILLGYLMYRSGLVPRSLALLGLIGGPLAFIGGVLVLFDVLKPMSAGLGTLTILEFLWELSLTIYILIKGFRPSPLIEDYGQGHAGVMG